VNLNRQKVCDFTGCFAAYKFDGFAKKIT